MSKVKLFGKTIQLPSNDDVLDGAEADLVADSDQNSDDDKNNAAMDSSGESPGSPSKKPDKILPCPRCKSNETKFCYFNNYNLNQPRHFCKNCQRYWTAGGAVRDVPVGSGRRKTKNPVAQSRPVAEAEQLGNGTCFPAPPWYPAQWAPVFATTPFWGYGLASSSPLGKHLREGEGGGGEKEENGATKTTRVLVPKTLRIDDPSESAKSSIWETLGIKNEKGKNSIGSGGVFGGFQSKTGETSSAADGALVLQANPAAFSRSLRFHESAE